MLLSEKIKYLDTGKEVKIKRILSICAVLVLTGIVSFMWYPHSELQRITKANYMQAKRMEKTLQEQLAFSCTGAEEADQEMPLLQGMDSSMEAYKIWDSHEKLYILVLEKRRKEISSVFYEDGRLAYGIVSNELPGFWKIKDTAGC